MNNKPQAIEQCIDFLHSNEKGMLLTGTHEYEKHKLIMKILNKECSNKLFLFRTNSLQNIDSYWFLGWAGVKKTPISGNRTKIRNNTYEFDSMYTKSTRSRTYPKFACALVYPIDYLCTTKKLEPIENLYNNKKISKIFLISCTDQNDYDYSIFSKYISRHVIYDAEEEDPEYHKRVIDAM